MPICTKCHDEFDKDCFYKRSNNPGKLHTWCKLCERIWTKAHQSKWYTRKKLANTMLWESEHQDLVKKYKKDWINSNRGKHAKSVLRWQSKNKDKVRAYQRRYRERNPEKLAHKSIIRRGKKMAAKGGFSYEEFVLLKSRHGNKCLCCGLPETQVRLTADHIIPLILGGNNYISNIQPLCGACNSSKGTKIINYTGGVSCPFTNTYAEHVTTPGVLTPR